MIFTRAIFALLIGYGLFGAAVNVRAEPLTILALGDSLTAGYGLNQEDSYPVRLQAALKAKGLDVLVVNAGVSGDTSAGGLSRLNWSLQPMPHLAIVELGANDGLRGLEPAQTKANLDGIVASLKEHKVTVLLTGMLAPPNLGKDYGAEFQAIYPDLAAQHDVTLYPFFLDGVAALPHLNQDDGIHPNAQGIGVLVERLLPAVEALLRKAQL